jgi:alpha-maltose-1-phosphate synthase
MACGAPVIASATGKILEVVVDGETGYLVPFEPEVVTGLPVHGGQFASDLARRIAKLMADPARCKKFGQGGASTWQRRSCGRQLPRRRWELYRRLAKNHK